MTVRYAYNPLARAWFPIFDRTKVIDDFGNVVHLLRSNRSQTSRYALLRNIAAGLA